MLVLAALTVFTCAAAGIAAASSGAAPASNAKVRLKARSYLMAGKRAVLVPKARLVLRGSLSPLTADDRVLIKASRKGARASEKVKAVNGTAGKTAGFTLGLKLRTRGKWTITAQRLGANDKPTGQSARLSVWVVKAHASRGSRGTAVRALQRRLGQLGYISPTSGHYNGTTARAVHAFRKVNGMSRNSVASEAVFRRLATGGGGFKLRYPKAGKHVEFDWSRQVVVLARGAKPVMTLHTSSGTRATPTDMGKFRVWLKQAGYNQKKMYYSVYFNRGEAIHGFASVPDQPASHGCLRIPISNAIRVYSWLDFGDVFYTYR